MKIYASEEYFYFLLYMKIILIKVYLDKILNKINLKN